MGAEVEWNEEAKTVTISKTVKEINDDGTITEKPLVIVLKIDDNIAIVNGTSYVLDVPATLRNSRTFVPLRFISSAIKKHVDWDEDSQSVVIEDEEPSDDAEIDEDTAVDADEDVALDETTEDSSDDTGASEDAESVEDTETTENTEPGDDTEATENTESGDNTEVTEE